MLNEPQGRCGIAEEKRLLAADADKSIGFQSTEKSKTKRKETVVPYGGGVRIWKPKQL